MDFYPGLSGSEKYLAGQLTEQSGIPSLFGGLFRKLKAEPFVKKNIINPVISADMRVGKGIAGSIKDPSKGLGKFLSGLFTQEVPVNVGANAFIRKRVPLASAPLAKARGVALPFFGLVGSMSILNALEKRKERKQQEMAMRNYLQGGQYGQ